MSKVPPQSRTQYFDSMRFEDGWCFCTTHVGEIKVPAIYRLMLEYRGLDADQFERTARDSLQEKTPEDRFAYINNKFPIEWDLFKLWTETLQCQNIVWEVLEMDCYGLRDLHSSGYEPHVLFDIGAHIGTFSLLASILWPNARIYAFEPHGGYPYSHVLFEHHMKGRENVELIKKPIIGLVDDSIENQEIMKRTRNDAQFSEFEYSLRQKSEEGTSEAMSLQSAMKLCDVDHIDFLKMDCEGCETHIFTEIQQRNLSNFIGIVRGEWHRREAIEALFAALSNSHRSFVCMGRTEKTIAHVFRSVPISQSVN